MTLVDLTHQLEPGDVDAAAFVWAQAAPWFPPETLHLGVVDPGVGGTRRALAARVLDQLWIAPDNGLLTWVLERASPAWAHAIEHPPGAPEEVSPVFHGRDLFAPAAAHLARGGDPRALGPELPPGELTRRPAPRPEASADADPEWRATVIHVDRFGNLVTNLPLDPATRSGRAAAGRHTVAFARTYSDVPQGDLVAVRGSSGLLEIARNGGSAAEHLGMTRGDVVKWRALERR